MRKEIFKLKQFEQHLLECGIIRRRSIKKEFQDMMSDPMVGQIDRDQGQGPRARRGRRVCGLGSDIGPRTSDRRQTA